MRRIRDGLASTDAVRRFEARAALMALWQQEHSVVPLVEYPLAGGPYVAWVGGERHEFCTDGELQAFLAGRQVGLYVPSQLADDKWERVAAQMRGQADV